MTALSFRIGFLSPFRVATGYAGGGVDNAIDPTDPLPASHLKGLMRATAVRVIGAPTRDNRSLVDEVFGSRRGPAPWHWSNAEPAGPAWSPPQPTARVQIDPTTHAAAHDMLAVSEQTWAPAAVFIVSQVGYIPSDRLPLHHTLLAVAGRGLRSLGGTRRRGLGWVSITCADVDLGEPELTALLAHRSTA